MLQSSVLVLPPPPVPPTLADRNKQQNENIVCGATEKNFLQITHTSTSTNNAPAFLTSKDGTTTNMTTNMTAAVHNLQQMLDKNLCLSFVQQQKFFMFKDRVLVWVNK
jgi:hypothetical protein